MVLPLLYILRNILGTLLSVYEILFLIRAVLSWFPDLENDLLLKLQDTVCAFTEPVLEPVRRILFRFEWVRSCPFDISFTVVFMLIIILRMMV